MESNGESGMAWYAVGCYYLSTKQRGAEAAIRAFSRATRADRGYAPAWLGLAAALGSCGEADAALGAYRTASRLFPGLHEPLLGMARAYATMNNVPLAEQVLSQVGVHSRLHIFWALIMKVNYPCCMYEPCTTSFVQRSGTRNRAP